MLENGDANSWDNKRVNIFEKRAKKDKLEEGRFQYIFMQFLKKRKKEQTSKIVLNEIILQ